MARYIDADAAVEEARLTHSCHGIICRSCIFDDTISFIEDYPAADVVPKSEVDRLEYEKQLIFEEGQAWHDKAEQNALELKAMRGAANSYKMHYEKAKSEVAMEIFEEIQKMVNRYWLHDDYGMPDMETELTKLKKKYTEDQT